MIHPVSIEKARQLAKEEGLSEEQIRFEVSSATDYPAYPQTNQECNRDFFNLSHIHNLVITLS